MIGQPQNLPSIMYGSFCDEINQDSVNRFLQNFTGAYRGGVREMHLFFYSHGGNVSDGVALYNYFRSLPFSLHIYNASAVDSAAIIPFVGSQYRYSSERAG